MPEIFEASISDPVMKIVIAVDRAGKEIRKKENVVKEGEKI